MRPTTSSNYSRSIPSSIRSDAVSLRGTRNGTVSSIRPFMGRSSQHGTGKQAISLPSEEVRVLERPVTAAGGLGGHQKYISSNGFNPKRQVQDTPYFLNLLQTKEKAIVKEIQKLNEYIKELELGNFERGAEVVHNDLQAEVQNLEGLLADHNITQDKLRRGCDPEDLESRQIELQMTNEKLENDLDGIFLLKQQCGKDIERVEDNIGQLHKSIQKIFQNVDPVMYDDYQRHTTQIQELGLEGENIELELEQMRANLHDLQSMTVNSNDYEVQRLYDIEQEKLNKLKSNMAEIDENLLVAQMDPEEAHSHLLQKVKSIQTKLNDFTMEEKKLNGQIESESLNLANLQRQYDRQAINKCDPSIKTRDKVQIDKSIKTAKEAIENITGDHKKKQNEILALLEDVSKNIETCNTNKPTKIGLKELNEDAEFRAKHLVNSKQTMARLVEQREKRLREVQMVENLESKILSEEKDLNRKMESMHFEINRYSDLNKLQEVAEITKIYLTQMKERYVQRHDFMESKVKLVSAMYEKNKSALNKNETWKSLLDLEEKLRRQGQVIFSLNEFVKTKEQQTNYEAVKNECLQTMRSIILHV